MKLLAYFTVQLLILVITSFSTLAQDKSTLSGYIKDETTGETLIGATVLISGSTRGAVSNIYGFYSLTVPQGNYKIVVQFVGYNSIEREVNLDKNLTMDFDLSEESQQLEEIVVSAEREDKNVNNIEMGTNRLEAKTIAKIPRLLGETDIIRSLQLLPGVSTAGEASSGFNIRGGGVDQNLILLDGAPVFNSSHLMGFFSIFNPDAVKNLKLVKGGIGVQYGGRLSSVLDIYMKEGSSRKFSVNGGSGFIFSRLTVEGPILKDKISFIVSGRRSYIDILAAPFTSATQFDGLSLYFYDLTAKVNYRINENNTVFISGYFGRDVVDIDISGSANIENLLGNTTGTIRWNHVFGKRLFLNLNTFYSEYDYKIGFATSDDTFDWNSDIISYNIKPEFTYFITPENELVFGLNASYYTFTPAKIKTSSPIIGITNLSVPEKYALETAAYVGLTQTLSDKISLQYGLRLSRFSYLGKGKKYTFNDATTPGARRTVARQEEFDHWKTISTDMNLEPRLSLKYSLNSTSSVKLSYNRMVQYLHLMSNTASVSPLSIWTPTTNNIPPQIGDQVALGYFRNFNNNTIEASAEVYYKTIQNSINYVDGANLLTNEFIAGDLLFGPGRSYGLELYLKKKIGKWNGWVSYTLSRGEQKIASINNGNWFPNGFDQTHNLKIASFWEVNDRWEISANFSFNTGVPISFPSHKLSVQGYSIPHNADTSRNNFRITPYHRIDVAATLYSRNTRNRYWVFSIYNLYARRNAYTIYFSRDDQTQKNQAKRISIIATFIPSVSYNFKF